MKEEEGVPGRRGRKEISQQEDEKEREEQEQMSERGGSSWAPPVEGVAHLNGDQDGQRHGHGERRAEDRALNAGEVGVALRALQVVGLDRREEESVLLTAPYRWCHLCE